MIVVTGATGQLGRLVMAELLERVPARSAVPEVACQRGPASLHHGQRDPVVLSVESLQHRRRAAPARPHGDAKSQPPNDPGCQVAAGGRGEVGGAQNGVGALEEDLARDGEVDPSRVSLEQLDTQLVLEPLDLRREAG
jgi:hypothetical protein